MYIHCKQIAGIIYEFYFISVKSQSIYTIFFYLITNSINFLLFYIGCIIHLSRSKYLGGILLIAVNIQSKQKINISIKSDISFITNKMISLLSIPTVKLNVTSYVQQ